MKQIVLALAATAGMLMAGSGAAAAATQQQMRFHCANDTTEINQLLQAGIESHLTSGNDLVKFYAYKLLGRPYVAHTLEGKQEWLTINIDELDCTTFVETLYALARTTMNGRYQWRDYANNLENLRYRGGTINGYASRLHYISDWSIDNVTRGNLVEVTGDMPGIKQQTKDINFMTRHRDNYPALADSATFARVRENEVGFRNHRSYYIKKELMNSKDVKAALREGDIVGLVTKIDGLDVSHMGIIVKDEKGNPHLLDASLKGGKVQVEQEDMLNYLRHKIGRAHV